MLRAHPLASFALVLALGCQPPPFESELPSPTEEAEIPEVTVSGASIRAEWSEEGGYFVSPRLLAPEGGASRVGTLVELTPGARPALIEARVIDADGYPGAWQALEVTWAEAGQEVARLDLDRLAGEVELRVPRAMAESITLLTYTALVPLPPRPRASSDIAAARPALHEALRMVGVNDRASWGARPTECTSSDPNKSRMAIHHTVTPATSDPATRLRGIQSFHMDTRNYCDIGYHFLISLDGQMWEGRPIERMGAHVLNHNTGNIGISFIGCFQTNGCMDWEPFVPPDAMLDAAATFVGALSEIYEIPIDDERVIGHRDHAGASTACPGTNLHARLEDIRAAAREFMPPVEGPRFGARLVDRGFPEASESLRLAGGADSVGFFEFENIGTETWPAGEVSLVTTEPRGGSSLLAHPDWLAPNRPIGLDADVAPGERGRFAFAVRGPARGGLYVQHFGLVFEGEGEAIHFGDPDEGGPADDAISLRVEVSGGDGGPAVDAGLSLGDGGLEPTSDGCGCHAVGAPGSAGFGLVALFAFGLFTRRRRARVG